VILDHPPGIAIGDPMKREPTEVNATRLDMKLMASRKALGMEAVG
jgi:hypothetical protein